MRANAVMVLLSRARHSCWLQIVAKQRGVARALKRRSSNLGLDHPVAAGYKPKFAGQLGKIAEILHTDYLSFDTEQQGIVHAIVYIIKLPENDEIRLRKPARIIAIGHEADVPALELKGLTSNRYVQQCDLNEWQYYVNSGDVTYAVITAK